MGSRLHICSDVHPIMCGLTKFCRLAVKSCGWGDIVNGIGVVCVEERVQRTEKR